MSMLSTDTPRVGDADFTSAPLNDREHSFLSYATFKYPPDTSAASSVSPVSANSVAI